jgi:hypothetical protein
MEDSVKDNIENTHDKNENRFLNNSPDLGEILWPFCTIPMILKENEAKKKQKSPKERGVGITQLHTFY